MGDHEVTGLLHDVVPSSNTGLVVTLSILRCFLWSQYIYVSVVGACEKLYQTLSQNQARWYLSVLSCFLTCSENLYAYMYTGSKMIMLWCLLSWSENNQTNESTVCKPNSSKPCMPHNDVWLTFHTTASRKCNNLSS